MPKTHKRYDVWLVTSQRHELYDGFERTLIAAKRRGKRSLAAGALGFSVEEVNYRTVYKEGDPGDRVGDEVPE